MLGKGRQAYIAQQADRLRPVIERHVDVVLSDMIGDADLSEVDADLAFVFGGDGSILRAANQLGRHQIPVVGVNLGRLGFLADLTPDEFADALPDITAGNCRVVDHLMFDCEISRDGNPLVQQIGLNETAILGGPPYSMLDIDLYVDAELVTTYSCDGLIVSTPVGSTAHSLSAGGPILRKNLQAFVISPISPHTLTVRPVVDTADRTYELVVKQPNEATSAVVDGKLIHQLQENDRVSVKRAESSFKLVEVRGHGYYRTLREKLGWGGRLRRIEENP